MPDILWPIPEPYWSQLQSIKQSTGVPISWIAALCQSTSWDPLYQTTNQRGGAQTWRQYGITGIWMDIPEVELPGQIFQHCGGGWAPKAPWVAGTVIDCSTCSPVTALQKPPSLPMQFDTVSEQLTLTGKMLKLCAERCTTWCGEVNGAMYLMWIFAPCFWPTDVEKAAGCTAINVPDIFKKELDDYLKFQALYAEQLGEDCVDPSLCGGDGGTGGVPWWLIALALGGAVVGGAALIEQDRKKKGKPSLFAGK